MFNILASQVLASKQRWVVNPGRKFISPGVSIKQNTSARLPNDIVATFLPCVLNYIGGDMIMVAEWAYALLRSLQHQHCTTAYAIPRQVADVGSVAMTHHETDFVNELYFWREYISLIYSWARSTRLTMLDLSPFVGLHCNSGRG